MAAPKNTNLYQEAKQLIQECHAQPARLDEIFQRPNLDYLGNPLQVYIYLIASTNPQAYASDLGSLITGLNTFRNQAPEQREKIKQTIHKFLENFLKDTVGSLKLDRKILADADFIPKEDHQRLEEVAEKKDEKEKRDLFQTFWVSKSGIEPSPISFETPVVEPPAINSASTEQSTVISAPPIISPEPIRPPRSIRLPRLSTPNFVKNLNSTSLIFVRKHLTFPAIAAAVGFPIGYQIGGLQGGLMAAAASAGTAGVVQSVGGEKVNQAISSGSNGSLNFLNGFRNLAVPGPGKFFLIPILIFLTFIGIMLFLGEGGGGGLGTPPVTDTTVPGDISQCLFYRGPTNSGIQYKSGEIFRYFAEAEKLSGIPQTLLAAIVRVENGALLSKSDSELTSYSSLDQCPISNTAAVGPMQIQPPRDIHEQAAALAVQRDPSRAGKISSFDETRAYSTDGVTKGAEFLNKTVDQLRLEDFCDVRSSIIMASGLILKKLQGRGVGDGTRWDPAWTNDVNVINTVAESYYGCLNYGDPDNLNKCVGPWNYGEDLWQSLTSCKPSQESIGDATCPIAGGQIGCASYGPSYGGTAFSGVCAPDKTGNGGHCNQNYIASVGICQQPVDPSTGNLIRTAKSIDVSNNTKPRDSVYLPEINGKKVTWIYRGSIPASNDQICGQYGCKPGYGWIKVFQTTDAAEGVWTLHLVHVDNDMGGDTEINVNDTRLSGQEGAKILYCGVDPNTGKDRCWEKMGNWPHVHITLGLNIAGGDMVFLDNAHQYDPGWIEPDRAMGMCR